MRANPLSVSMETLIAVSPLLGHKLEDRASVREAQDPVILREVQSKSTVALRSPSQAPLFLVAPLDILVVEADGRKQFYVTEVNGTGIGGLTNLSKDAIGVVLQGLSQMAEEMPERNPLVLVGISGQESSRNPRQNHTIHEKVLYAEALKYGFEGRGQEATVLAMSQHAEARDALPNDKPAVLLGYMKEFLEHLALDPGGRLELFGRPVTAAVNDRFCLNVISRFGNQVDLNHFATMNRCFLPGADKGVAYGLLNDYMRKVSPGEAFPERVEFSRVSSRIDLIATVMDWVHAGRRAVIKAQGTGLGHGIEFFLDRDEARAEIISKIDHSIRVTEHYYGLVGGAFPYTVCEFVDTCKIARKKHAFFGHKYELRVVVYRDGASLKAFPSIIKVSSTSYDEEKQDRQSLLNNISTAAEKTRTEGTEHMLPLCNHETLALIGMTPEQLVELSVFCTGYVRFILDQVEDDPQRLGLPGSDDGAAGGQELLSTAAAGL